MKLEAGLRHNKATGAWDLRQADDGSIWREATPQELADALKDNQDLLVWMGREGTDPRSIGEWADYKLAGNYPFIVGIAQLTGGVYLRVASSYEEYLSGEEDSHE